MDGLKSYSQLLVKEEKLDANTITFNTGTEILRLTEEGFHFKGETITDAGGAYKIFMEVMSGMKKTQEAE